MESYTFGTTPVEKLKEIFTENYPMSLVGEDRDVMICVVNQGIDSHLEGFTESSFKDTGYRLECDISPKDMLILLRRLLEIHYEEMFENACSLRSGILETMDIEEI